MESIKFIQLVTIFLPLLSFGSEIGLNEDCNRKNFRKFLTKKAALELLKRQKPCDLTGFDFRTLDKKVLNGALFYNFNLTGAIFDGVILNRTKFYKTNLTKAQFKSSQLFYVSMDKVKLESSDFYRASVLRSNFKDLNFVKSNLFQTLFHKNNMFYVSFAHANLRKTSFQDTTLSYVKLSSASLKETNFFRTKFHYMDLRNVDFSHAILLNRATFFRTKYWKRGKEKTHWPSYFDIKKYRGIGRLTGNLF